MNRRNQVLTALLVVQVAVLAVVFWPRNGTAGQAGALLFPGLQADQVVGLTLSSPGAEPVQLSKSEGGWVLPQAGDYPALADKVSELVAKIVALQAGQPVTTSGSAHARLKVAADDYERKIELALAGGAKKSLLIGTGPSYGSAHVRAGDQDQVYLASGLPVQDVATRSADWVEQAYLTIDQEQVVSFTLKNAQGTYQFEKQAAGWTMKGLKAGEALDTTVITGLLGRLGSLSLTRPLGKEDKPEYGTAKPGAVITIKTQAGSTYELTVGAKEAAGTGYAVKSSESEFYVLVGEFAVKDLVEMDRAGFLVQPTATPEPTPTP
jgi:hypothetical protein